MPAVPTVEQLLARNKEYTKTYTPPHNVEHFMIGKGTFPSVLMISCVDPRIIPEEFGLFSREEYIVVRNAGGRAEPAIRDISVLCSMAKITDLIVIHHVDCGMTHLTNDAIRKSLKSAGLGDEKLDTMEFGEILDLKQSVIDDVEFLKSSPYISKEIKVHGYVMDLLKSGSLIPV